MKNEYLEKQEKVYRWLLQEKLTEESKLLLQQAMANVKREFLGRDAKLEFSMAMVHSPRQSEREFMRIEDGRNQALKIDKASQDILGVKKRNSRFEINEGRIQNS